MRYLIAGIVLMLVGFTLPFALLPLKLMLIVIGGVSIGSFIKEIED